MGKSSLFTEPYCVEGTVVRVMSIDGREDRPSPLWDAYRIWTPIDARMDLSIQLNF